MRRFSLAVVSALLFASSPASAVPINILGNADFETGVLSPWVQGIDASNPFAPTSPWDVVAGAGRFGSFGATATNNFEIRQDFAAVDTDEIIEASAWIRHPVGLNGGLSLITFFYDDGFDDIFVAITDNGAWTFFDALSVVQPGKMLIGFSVFGFTSGIDEAISQLDDVRLIANVADVSEPAPLALAAMGLGLLVMRRRKAA